MEKTQSKKVEVLVKAIEEEEIIIHDTKEINIKGEEIKTTQYFLNVKNQDTNSENQETQYVTVEECDETHNQFVTVEVDESNPILIEDKDVILWNELCRICANSSDRFIPIFTGEGLEHNLCNKIHTYLPVRVSESDTLPLQLCYSCAATLLAWHEMSKGCLDAQQRLIDLQTKFQLKEQYYNESTMEEETVLEVETTANEESQIQDEPADTEQEIQVVDLNDTDRSQSAQMTFKSSISTQIINKKPIKQLSNISSKKISINNVDQWMPVTKCTKSLLKNSKTSTNCKNNKEKITKKQRTVQKKSAITQKDSYVCVECGRQFKVKDSLVRHLRIHRDERPFTCYKCGKQFRDSGGLCRHLRDVHAGVKSFACEICNKYFASKTTRDDHQRIHTGERPYVCDNCGKSFKSKASLYTHAKTHTNNFPYPCLQCERKFRRRQELLTHVTTHTGEKNFACDICSKRFRMKTELKRHILIHSDDKPFVCTICGFQCRQKRYLNNHIRHKHSLIEKNSIYK